jgi:uroporphyrinogen-III decarboxylase
VDISLYRIKFDRVRVEESKSRLEAAWNLEEPDSIPTVVQMQWPYGTSGRVPEGYYSDNDFCLKWHINEIRRYLKYVEDDYIPHLFLWYGVAAIPEVFGAKIRWEKDRDPQAEPIIKDVGDMDQLEVPDLSSSKMVSRILSLESEWKEKINIPIAITDNQGPLDVAVMLRGLTPFLRDMYLQPRMVHRLMKIVTKTIIEFVKMQKEIIREDMDECAACHGGIWAPKGVGVWISEDYITQLSPKLFREFVMPYDEEIFQTFGGGMIHACGDSTHQINNYLDMPHLRCIDFWLIGDLSVLKRLKECLGRKKCLVVGEFTPEDPIEFFREMIAIGAPDGGLIINTATGDDILAVRGKGYIDKKGVYAKRLEFSKLIVKEVKQYGKYTQHPNK